MREKAQRFDVAVIGAGPAGLAASIAAAKAKADVIVVDENDEPGGQLFKQIHKFFGSSDHQAGRRGFDIGRQLLSETEELGVDVLLGATVWGIFDRRIAISKAGANWIVHAKRIVIATGAQEKLLRFSGWTLPGVMTAGAAQTMVNIHRVLPGKRILMIGSGNVGLIVAYQLLQAGAEVHAVLETEPKIGGYFVHAAKIARAGIPILLSHTITRATGMDQVDSAVIVALGESRKPITGTEKRINVDTILLAVGMSPQEELPRMCECEMCFSSVLGGYIPFHDHNMETSVQGIYVAGDVAGVEEASTAIDEGRIAGISAVESLGLLSHSEAFALKSEIWERLDQVRSGPFGEKLHSAKTWVLEEAIKRGILEQRLHNI